MEKKQIDKLSEILSTIETYDITYAYNCTNNGLQTTKAGMGMAGDESA